MNRALTLKWFAVLGLASLFYLLAPRDVSPQMPLYLGMTSAAVIIWTFDLLPAVAVAAALTFLYLLTNMAPPEVVLGPWTTVLIWTTFGAAIFGEAMEKTGLAKRVALRCMLLTGGTFTGMLIGFAIGGIILGLLLQIISDVLDLARIESGCCWPPGSPARSSSAPSPWASSGRWTSIPSPACPPSSSSPVSSRRRPRPCSSCTPRSPSSGRFRCS